MGPGGAVWEKTDYKKSRETVPLRMFGVGWTCRLFRI